MSSSPRKVVSTSGQQQDSESPICQQQVKPMAKQTNIKNHHQYTSTTREVASTICRKRYMPTSGRLNIARNAKRVAEPTRSLPSGVPSATPATHLEGGTSPCGRRNHSCAALSGVPKSAATSTSPNNCTVQSGFRSPVFAAPPQGGRECHFCHVRVKGRHFEWVPQVPRVPLLPCLWRAARLGVCSVVSAPRQE